ncbi:MAG TPA: DUF2911 domain-containing protein [Terriglobia bacterium]|nr:DUF2911 domain-containing protein [Terriglobia bacterium]
MKRLTIGTLTLAALCACAVIATAQRNPRGNAKLTLNGQEVTVDYGRPSLKGRKVEDMLGQVKPGGVWRLGADQSTTFTTGTDLVFGEVTVPKGTYSLWARKEADGSWKLVFNTQHGQWGTNHDASKDADAVPLTETKASSPTEQVTINLTEAGGGGRMTIEWGDMQLAADFKAK